ncbi:unnamed protein product [Rhodiola kirilowii]
MSSYSSTDSEMEIYSKAYTEIKGLHHPDGREIDVKSLLQHVKDIILFTNEEEQEKPRMVTSKEVPPLTWCKSLLLPLEKLMRDISKRDNKSAVAVSILKELQPYAWGAKAVLVLTSFAMNHGLWMLAQMYSAIPPSLTKVKDNNKLYSVLSRVLSNGSELDSYYFYLSLILSFSKRPKENTLPKPALTSLFKDIVLVVECIIELQDLPSEDLRGYVTGYETTMDYIPIYVHHVITTVIYCAAVINQFPDNDYEISEAEDNKLSMYASDINEEVKILSKLIKDCNQFLEETKYDKEIQIPIPETSSMDNREALKYLIKSGGDPKLLNAADTIISQLKGKHVMLLVSDDDSSMDEIRILDEIYRKITSQRGMKEKFSILWIPLYSGIGKERAAQHFQTQIRNMNWYAVPHPSMVSKEATEFIKKKWQFQSKSNILVMLDPQGTVLNINAFHMICVWGGLGFPFTRSRERALWKTVTFNMLFILDAILPATFEWIPEGKYIFLYSGDDIEWVRKFTTTAKRVSQKFNNPVELLYVGKPSKGVHQRTTKKIKDTLTNEGLGHVLDETMTGYFWSRLRSMLISKMSHQNREESEDRMTRQLKWLLGYETKRSWALLGIGDEVLTHGPGSTILQALMEYDTKNVGEYEGNLLPAIGNEVGMRGPRSKLVGFFGYEFEKLHEKVVSSGRVCCQVEFPVLSSGMPETMRCPQPNCKTEMMDKSIVFECCHHKPLPER